MITALRRVCRWIPRTAIASCLAVSMASAQTPDSSPPIRPALARVSVGEIVHVTDRTGATIKGALAALTDDVVALTAATGLRKIPASDVRRIQWQQRDSPLTGVFIGAAIGAVPGIYWLVADPNECSGMCPEEYALIAMGAAIGGVIDHLITKRITVYSAPPPRGAARSVAIGPLVDRHRTGVQVAVRF